MALGQNTWTKLYLDWDKDKQIFAQFEFLLLRSYSELVWYINPCVLFIRQFYSLVYLQLLAAIGFCALSLIS